MPTPIIGDIGGRLDIQLRVGTSVGPFLITIRDSSGGYVSYTGSTLTAKARTRHRPTPVNVAMIAVLADPADYPGADWVSGQGILLSATPVESAKFQAPASVAAQPAIADWNLEAVKPDASRSVVLFGEIKAYLRLP